MPARYIIASAVGLFAIVGWNVFLAQRDAELFRANQTPHEKVCAQLNTWHPDCKVE